MGAKELLIIGTDYPDEVGKGAARGVMIGEIGTKANWEE